MAANQTERHKLGRKGEGIARKMLGGKATKHTAPFDVVDFASGYAYEVKSMSGLSKDMKIHISDASMERKVKFATEYGLMMMLIAVVIYSPNHVETYRTGLKQCVRVNQMERIS